MNDSQNAASRPGVQRMDKARSAVIAAASVILVGLTLYTAYFGVFPDGIQRSAHLLLVMVLVFTMALRATYNPDMGGGTATVRRVWIVLALIGAVIATGHQFFNFDAINNRYGAITQYEIYFGAALVIALISNPLPAFEIQWPFFIAHGAFIGAASCLLTLGPRYISSGEVSLLILLESVLAPVLVWLVIGEDPGPLAMIGGAVVIGALIVSNLYAIRAKR